MRRILTLHPAAHALLLLVLSAALYWTNLGAHGFRSTEGHRAIPAYELLERGEAVPTRMFERVYVRKPPGMPWVIAGSTTLFNESEWSARAPSALAATLGVLLTWGFASMWFGRSAGFVAAVAHLLTLRFLPGARTAEIEGLFTLATALGALPLVHALVCAQRARIGWGVVAGVGIGASFLMKGPAAAPVFIGVLLASGLIVGWRRTLRAPAAWLALGIGGAISALVVLAMARSVGDEPAVTESASHFVLNLDRIGGLPLFAVTVLLGAMPASLALLFPWGPDAKHEAAQHEPLSGPYRTARVLTIGCLLSLAIYMLLLVTNPRYGLPSVVLIPPVVGYVALGMRAGFTDVRARIARTMMLVRAGAPISALAWPLILLGVAAFWIYSHEAANGTDSGRAPGRALGEAIAAHAPHDGPVVVWANYLVEARPETLHYAERSAASRGVDVRVEWRPTELPRGELPEPGSFVALREVELAWMREAGVFDRLEPLHDGRVHKFEFTLYRVTPGRTSE